jgi:hypothetical protein
LSADKKPETVQLYQLKVVLREVSPMLWRRLLVKSDTTIADLHAILQIAVGWEDCHLHRFHIHGKDYGIAYIGGISFADNPHTVLLSDFRLHKGERFLYEYDMGDLWQHDIRLEEKLALEPRRTYPTCSGGQGACPPEDSGGPYAYMHQVRERFSWEALEDLGTVADVLRHVIQTGKRPEDEDDEWHEAMERFLARERFNPAGFSCREVNAQLRQWRKERCTSKSTSS